MIVPGADLAIGVARVYSARQLPARLSVSMVEESFPAPRPRRPRRRPPVRWGVLAAVVVVVAVLAAALLSAAIASSAPLPRAVALSDAERPPTTLVYVLPHRTAIVGEYVEVSAYRWDGGALSPQRWNRIHDRIIWRDRAGRPVIFDGIGVHNHTRRPILFAGWAS